ncbi:failed axon connections protein [Aphelenchoides avenae]|nr:failed axon connections protein [Aphelenchus avenae]
MLKATKRLLVRDWKQDTIYFVQYPRCGSIVSVSPWAIKLETFFRFNKLPYVSVSNEFKHGCAKEPCYFTESAFVELNGRQIAGHAHIIEELKLFKLPTDSHLNSHEQAEARALTLLVEESLFRCMQYDRSRGSSWMGTSQGMIQHLHGIKKVAYQMLGIKIFERRLRKVLRVQGIDRFTPAEVDEIFEKDLLALSSFLADKPYFFGRTPSTVDATLFATLVSILNVPINAPHWKTFAEQKTPNLVALLGRVKTEYWPDWDEICRGLLLNPTDNPIIST